MKCRDIDKLMVLAAYGEATADGQRSLEFHLQHCSDCKAKYRALQEDLGKISDNTAKVPEFDWEESGKNIQAALDMELKKRARSRFLFGMPFKAAAAVGIFCLGILVGWLAFHSPSLEVSGDVDLSGKILSLLDRHLGAVRISLLEYLNFHDQADRSVFLSFEQKQADQLLFQNRLLISSCKESENRELIGLLENLNFILQEITNLSPEKPEYLTFIKSLLRDSDILLRIDYFQREGFREKSEKERLL